MSKREVEALREQKREFYWFHDDDDDGTVVIHGRFTPEEGLVVCRTIDTMTKPIREARQADWDAVHKGRMQAAARNIIARARDAEDRVITGEDFNAPPDVEYEQAKETISAETYKQFMNQSRADAFVGLVEHSLAMAPNYSQLQGLKGAERCQVVLQVDVNTLREQQSGVLCTWARRLRADAESGA
ncbi:hypothetical protein BST95_00290 [Halioglobus japonicus]|uniref:Uncharacterized protein n=1 Tax=Halioglobus japonicus TaxID=930805 RepID=A0AAP8MBJ9_9GAMM|nr:hypothetical protein [Halioglobus japonicus]AQA16887.1 hypothetical protein BST95_00290 [Halioglobus japonicus]PLW84773.1 hypothetical protein C0029_17385 [Halioglobus japonicus]GHD21351.1 hypothetical protein GCM10007052_32030 [Halioglobus japonicus]